MFLTLWLRRRVSHRVELNFYEVRYFLFACYQWQLLSIIGFDFSYRSQYTYRSHYLSIIEQQRDPSFVDKDRRRAIYVLSFLFFTWGFLSCLTDLLVPYLRGVFELSYFQAMLVQFSFFSAFFLFAIPLGFIVGRVGYRNGVVIGLTVAAIGCLLFFPAAQLISYPFFLFALFVLATGICCLQVSANPYVVLLGRPETATRRLNLTQGFNSLGTTVAPYVAAIFIFSTISEFSSGADAVKLPYLFIATVLLSLAVFFNYSRLPNVAASDVDASPALDEDQKTFSSSLSRVFYGLMSNRAIFLGALGIFFYVGVEVSIGSLLVNFIADESIGDMSEAQASQYVSVFWLAAMIGRFAGFFLMAWMRPSLLLLFNAVLACFLVGIAVLGKGSLAMWAILAVGLCNSIMFPTIFSLAIAKAGLFASQGSGILCLAIVGGAVIPVIQGLLADTVGLQNSLSLSIAGYIYIAWYAYNYSLDK